MSFDGNAMIGIFSWSASNDKFYDIVLFQTDNVRDYEVEINYSEHFYKDNVTISLNYSRSHENPFVSFNIAVVPQLPATMIRNLQSPVTISLFYNTDYNVSVVASLCGQVVVTKSVGLFYGKCTF